MNGLDWLCYLAGNSKTVPRILIFSIAMGADNSFELISIETYKPQFIGYNDLFLGSVGYLLANESLNNCQKPPKTTKTRQKLLKTYI